MFSMHNKTVVCLLQINHFSTDWPLMWVVRHRRRSSVWERRWYFISKLPRAGITPKNTTSDSRSCGRWSIRSTLDSSAPRSPSSSRMWSTCWWIMTGMSRWASRPPCSSQSSHPLCSFIRQRWSKMSNNANVSFIHRTTCQWSLIDLCVCETRVLFSGSKCLLIMRNTSPVRKKWMTFTR